MFPVRLGKRQDSRENKTNYFPEGQYIKCSVIYLDFGKNKETKTACGQQPRNCIPVRIHLNLIKGT